MTLQKETTKNLELLSATTIANENFCSADAERDALKEENNRLKSDISRLKNQIFKLAGLEGVVDCATSYNT